MKKRRTFRFYTVIVVVVGLLSAVRLALWVLESDLPEQYTMLLGFVSTLPEPVLTLPILLQKHASMWSKWIWFWKNCWIFFAALLLLPRLKLLLKIAAFLQDIVVELLRISGCIPRTVTGWVIRLRCKSVTLENCQYVIVCYSDGIQQVVDIQAAKTWWDWRGASENPPVLLRDDDGEVSLLWKDHRCTVLRDRQPLTGDMLKVLGFREPQNIEAITLFDDRGR